MGSKSIFVGRKSKFVGRKSNFVGSIFVGSELIKICGHFEVKFVGTQKYMPKKMCRGALQIVSTDGQTDGRTKSNINREFRFAT